ncbi:hypothetical protein O181_015708 [Austropuccinia psidii MF-1]|uniref:Uncharacterized protein n=1 Tax=Austropuccinia psidii MF-1 TaxID=1389203 RepID=A0A9Q3C3Q8_9BASI|nr:hypothetical protein [Austropuccinia psidii MF-1]
MKHGDGKRTFELGLIIIHGIQTPKKKPTKSPPTRLTRSTYALRRNPLQAQVAPVSWRTYPANPPNMMSHLFLARVHSPNHLRTFQLVSQNLMWLQCNAWRNLLVSHDFTFFTPINFSSPLLQPSPACPATP